MPLKDRLRSRSPRDIRNEREELGFVRQPEVRWMTPSLLLKTGVEVAVSGTFGKFADKREIQCYEQNLPDYSGADELWIDYLSDTGDGFDATYTMAWLLAREQLEVDEEVYPSVKVARRLGHGVLRLAQLNPGFATLFGGIPDPLELSGAVRRATSAARCLTPLVHAAAHVLLVGLVVWLALKLGSQSSNASIVAWLLGAALAFAAGATVGTTIWALLMWLVHTVRASKAPQNANDVFTSQSIVDYKNLLRMRLRRDGGLTIYPLGVDRVGRDRRYAGKRDDGPWFEPRGAPPAVHPIDRPLEFDRTGARVV